MPRKRVDAIADKFWDTWFAATERAGDAWAWVQKILRDVRA